MRDRRSRGATPSEARAAAEAIHRGWVANQNPSVSDAGNYLDALSSLLAQYGAKGPCEELPRIDPPEQLEAWCCHHQARFEALDREGGSSRPPIGADSAIAGAWRYLRQLSGDVRYPEEPDPPQTYREAIRYLDRVVSWCRERRNEQAALSPAPDPREPRYQFQKIGDVWHVRFDGEFGTFHDTKGFETLARLLANPRKPIPAVQLAGPADDAGKPTRSMQRASQLGGEDETAEVGPMAPSAQPAWDEEANRSLHSGLKERAREIQEAREAGEEAKTVRLENEFEELTRIYQRDRGLGGKPRNLRTGDPAEKAMATVRQQIRRAYQRLLEVNPPLRNLVSHLRLFIQTRGPSYVYDPDPQHTPDWETS